MRPEYNREEQEVAKAFRRLFNSPNGKVVLDYLRDVYGEAPIPVMPTGAMAAAVGARNVYVDIIEQIKIGEENG